jgi:hypothetical protein
VKSRTSADVSELGFELIKELGEVAERDLLARWMAEYLGEKLSQLKKVRGAGRKGLSAECADLIVRLWVHRHSLPSGAAPLASFEPLFKALNELSGGQPRYSFLRDLPQAKKGSRVEEIISGALALDKSASSLIRYFLAEAVSMIPVKDKRWVKLRAVTQEPPWDIEIILRAIGDAETLVDKKARLDDAEIEVVQGMLRQLRAFEESSGSLRTILEEKLKALNRSQPVTKSRKGHRARPSVK